MSGHREALQRAPGGDVELHDEPSSTDLGLVGPAPDEIHDQSPRAVRDSDPGQSSAIFIFSATYSAISAARTSPVVWILFSGQAIRLGSAQWFGRAFCAKAGAPFSKNSLAGSPKHRRVSRSALCPLNAAAGWRHSLSASSAPVTFSCVLSLYLNGRARSPFSVEPEHRLWLRTSAGRGNET